MVNFLLKSFIGLFLLSLFFQSCKDPEETVVHIDKEEFTIEDQVKIGMNLSALIKLKTDQYKVLNFEEHAIFYEYINMIFDSVINTIMVENRNAFDWEIIILEDDNISSAFIIPGGKLYIYTGLLKMINSENELFSILAHESYYAEKAVVVGAMKSEYGTLSLGDLVLGTSSEGAIEIAETVHDLSYTSGHVANADNFAMEIVCPFEYEARGLKTFIERASNSINEVRWLTNRPADENRLNVIEATAENCGLEEQTFVGRYTSYKNMLP